MHFAVEREHLLPQLERLVPAAGRVVGNCQVVHRGERVGVFRAVGGQIVISNLLLQRDGLAVKTQRVIGRAERGLEFGPASGLVG